jgi:hypothetical protein
MAKKKTSIQEEIDTLFEISTSIVEAEAEMFGIIGKDMGEVQRDIAATQVELEVAKKRISELESINLEKRREAAWEDMLKSRAERGEVRTYKYDGGTSTRTATFNRAVHECWDGPLAVEVVRVTQKPGEVSMNVETVTTVRKESIAELNVFMPRTRVVAGILIGIGLTLIGVAVF